MKVILGDGIIDSNHVITWFDYLGPLNMGGFWNVSIFSNAHHSLAAPNLSRNVHIIQKPVLDVNNIYQETEKTI